MISRNRLLSVLITVFYANYNLKKIKIRLESGNSARLQNDHFLIYFLITLKWFLFFLFLGIR